MVAGEVFKSKESYPKYTQNALSIKPACAGKPRIIRKKRDVKEFKGKLGKVRKVFQNTHKAPHPNSLFGKENHL